MISVKTVRQHVKETGSLDGFHIAIAKELGLYLDSLGPTSDPEHACEYTPGTVIDGADVVPAKSVFAIDWYVNWGDDGAGPPQFGFSVITISGDATSKSKALQKSIDGHRVCNALAKTEISDNLRGIKLTGKRIKQLEKLRAALKPKKKKKKGAKPSKKKPAKSRKKVAPKKRRK